MENSQALPQFSMALLGWGRGKASTTNPAETLFKEKGP